MSNAPPDDPISVLESTIRSAIGDLGANQEVIAPSVNRLFRRTEDLVRLMKQQEETLRSAEQSLSTGLAALRSSHSIEDETKAKDEKKIQSLQEEVDRLKAALEAVEGQRRELEALKESSAQVQASLESASTRAEAAETAQKKSEQQLATVSEELARARADLKNSPSQEEMDKLRQELDAERDRAGLLDKQLEDEMAKGTKSSLAKQLAEAINDAEESREQLRHTQQELERLRRQQLVSSPEEAVQRVKAVAGQSTDGSKRSIGELLLLAGIVTEEQVEWALETQKKNPQQHLGSILVERGFVNEDAVAQALALQCNVEFIRFAEGSVTPEAAQRIGKRLAIKHGCIPMRVNTDGIVVAMCNPVDLVAIEDLERATGSKVEVVVAVESEIRRAIEQHYA